MLGMSTLVHSKDAQTRLTPFPYIPYPSTGLERLRISSRKGNRRSYHGTELDLRLKSLKQQLTGIERDLFAVERASTEITEQLRCLTDDL